MNYIHPSYFWLDMASNLILDHSNDRREYPLRPICGVGAVVCRGDEVLLIQRGNPPRRGDWSLPGGAVELGETLREAVTREVGEECGIEITITELLDTFEFFQRDNDGRVQYHYIILDFAAEYVSGEVHAASDVLDARWVTTHDLNELPLPAKTREVIDRAMTKQSGNR